jgi:uncharacterized protein YydD (DUF2326 family)
MKLDLEYLMTEVKDIQRELKKARNKDKEIMSQHKEIFQLLSSGNDTSGYSYGN